MRSLGTCFERGQICKRQRVHREVSLVPWSTVVGPFHHRVTLLLGCLDDQVIISWFANLLVEIKTFVAPLVNNPILRFIDVTSASADELRTCLNYSVLKRLSSYAKVLKSRACVISLQEIEETLDTPPLPLTLSTLLKHVAEHDSQNRFIPIALTVREQCLIVYHVQLTVLNASSLI